MTKNPKSTLTFLNYLTLFEGHKHWLHKYFNAYES